MVRFKGLLSAILAGVAVAWLASPAQASFQIAVFVDGAANPSLVTTGTANNFSANGVVGDGVNNLFNVSVNSQTNWNGSQQGDLMSDTSNNTITALFGSGTHTLTILISENDWMAPTTNKVLLSDSTGGSIGVIGIGATNNVSASVTGYLDTSNALPTTINPGGSATPTTSASASVTGTGFTNTTAPLVFNPGTVSAIVNSSTPFTLTEKLVYTFTVSGNPVIASGGSSTTLTATVPVPAGVVLALSGLPVLGAGAWLRRRRKVVA